MAWYDPRDWFKIGNTGFDAEAERDRHYQDYDINTDPFGQQIADRMRGIGRLGAEEQARQGAGQARRQAGALAYSAEGVRTGAAQRAAERSGDMADIQAVEAARVAREQDQLAARQILGQLMQSKSQAAQQRASIDQLYAQMGFKSAMADYQNKQLEDAGFLGFLGNAIGSLF